MMYTSHFIIVIITLLLFTPVFINGIILTFIIVYFSIFKIRLIILINLLLLAKDKCDLVKEGDFYANGEIVNFWGFKSSTYMEREYILNNNTAQYVLPLFLSLLLIMFYY